MIIGILGFIGAGKDTASNFLVNHKNFIKDSFAAHVKDVCSVIFCWPREMVEGNTPESRKWRDTVDVWWSEKLKIPNFTPRLAMQLIGTNTLRNHFNDNIWILSLQRKMIEKALGNFVISDVRFPNEVKFMQNNNSFLLWVNNGQLPAWYDIALEANSGNITAEIEMKTQFSNVHHSEWAWLGSPGVFEIDNSQSKAHLYSQLSSIVDFPQAARQQLKSAWL